ncbi:peptidylprolyl isomerase [Roseobacter sinensis]|uniref:Parvulin-like PPIase n=1 Tax=Roseobacter sinensis TaxID=2931391 RepID=A0ABT3BEC5_9RHOB|nr:peptidylprolyl isomerase [Roseobacter sp. WL0113]MCV3271924.1 peptidylprolyl isomerase [Roseobacter sp. WL0113]
MTAVSRLSTIIALATGIALAAPVAAQGLFDPAVYVNDDVVTEYEIEQRAAFLRLLNSPGSGRADVIETLVNERLQAQAVEAAGFELTTEALEAGMEEFAARANLSAEQFIIALTEGGVAEQTFRDFVEVGIAWRDLIGARFGARVQISETEIDRALGSSGGTTGIRVLVSEIIIPAPPEQKAQVDEIALEIAASQSTEEFSNYAREFSATASREAGGRLPWQDLNNLPPVLRPILLSLAPGEITDPLPIPNAVALFQLRDIEETGAPSQSFAAIEYAAYYIPGGRSPAALATAERVRAEVDVCDDLYGIAQGQPEEVLERGSRPPGEIPQDIAFELSKLDPGEVSTALTRANGETLVFLMLCGRTSEVNQDVAREDVARSLRSARLNAYADSLLDQLRADARIVTP